MISYCVHPYMASAAYRYQNGWRVVETDDVERLKNGISKCVWSPIAWKDGVRCEKNFLYAEWCVLDIDEPSPDFTLRDVCAGFSHMKHIIGTTKSHQVAKGDRPTCDRFRLLFPFERRITDLRIYRWNMYRLQKIFPIDKACKDGARYFFPCKEIIQCDNEGYLQEVDENPPDWFERYQDPHAQQWDARRGTPVVPLWTRRQLDSIMPIGERNDLIYRIAKDLTRFGFQDEKKILDIVIHSATYSGQVSTPLLQELRGTIKSAMKKVASELSHKPADNGVAK